jgi:preprotein translocase subunit SecF
MSNLGQRLYSGESSIDFIGHRRRWYAISAVILIIAIGALLFRGLNLGIEFRGGADFSLPNATCSVEDARGVAETFTGAQVIVTETASGTIRVQTETLTPEESIVLGGDLAAVCGISPSDVKTQVVGPTWGAEISKKALQGLIVFLLLVMVFLSI